jgi:hypothetical protein
VVRSQREAAIDAFADAAARSISEVRSKHGLPAQWKVGGDIPKVWAVSSNPEAASDCARAISHTLGEPLRIDMSHSGIAWLRVVAPAEGYWSFDARISEFDNRMSVYRDCRDVSRSAQRTSDDGVGLGASLGLNAKHAGQSFLIKFERVGGMGTLAIAKSALSTSISGRVVRASDGQPLRVAVVLINASTNWLSDRTYTDSDGNYYFQPYADQLYYVRTAPAGDNPALEQVVHEAFPGAPCASLLDSNLSLCDGQITAINAADGSQHPATNFSLQQGASIAGVVRSNATGSPVADALLTQRRTT